MVHKYSKVLKNYSNCSKILILGLQKPSQGARNSEIEAKNDKNVIKITPKRRWVGVNCVPKRRGSYNYRPEAMRTVCGVELHRNTPKTAAKASKVTPNTSFLTVLGHFEPVLGHLEGQNGRKMTEKWSKIGQKYPKIPYFTFYERKKSSFCRFF